MGRGTDRPHADRGRSARFDVFQRAFFDNSPDAFIAGELINDEDGTPRDFLVRAANRSLERHTGLSPDDVVGRTAIGDGVFPQLRTESLHLCAEVLRSQTPRRTEVARSGDPGGWVEALIVPISASQFGALFRDVTDQRRDREALKDSRALYRLIAENSSDIVFTTDLRSRLQWVSPSISRVLGWEPDELLNHDVRTLIHPDDHAAWLGVKDAEGGRGVVELRARHRDGRYLWLSAFFRRTTHPGSGEVSRIGGARLIEDERRSRDALQRTTQLLETAWDSLMDPHVSAISIRGTGGEIIDFRLVSANAPACAQIGLERASLIGRRVSDLPDSTVLVRLGDILADVVATGESVTLEDFAVPPSATLVGTARSRSTEAPDADGRDADATAIPAPRRVDVNVVRVGDGFACDWRDVSDRFAGVQELYERESWFRHALNQAPTPLAVLDLDGRFRAANPAFGQLVDRDLPWLLRHELRHVMFPGQEARLRAMTGRLLRGESLVEHDEQRFVTSSGEPVAVQHLLALVRGGDGSPKGIVSAPQVPRTPPQPTLRARPDAIRVRIVAEGGAELLAAGAAAMLAGTPRFVVNGVGSVADAPDGTRSRSPDVLVLVVDGTRRPGRGRLPDPMGAVRAEQPLVVLCAARNPSFMNVLTERVGPTGLLPAHAVTGVEVLQRVIDTVAAGISVLDHKSLGKTADRFANGPLAHLSARELEVLGLVAAGWDNHTIAGKLVLSTKAVENYVGTTYRKLGLSETAGISRRVKAALLYRQYRHGD